MVCLYCRPDGLLKDGEKTPILSATTYKALIRGGSLESDALGFECVQVKSEKGKIKASACLCYSVFVVLRTVESPHFFASPQVT